MFFIKEYLFIRLTYSKKLAIIYRIMTMEVTDMPQNKGPFYMTTAIAYTSGKPHIGNTYEIVLADSIARFRRQEGYDVFFQTGTDEHGQKIELKAEEAGITPKEFVDNVSTEIKRIWDLMDTSYDKFIRTTDDYHEKQVQKIFKKLYDQGDIYKGSYEGMYCTPCESFWTESQLVDGKCPDCGREVKPAKEEAYFFKMSKYANRLIEHINTHPEFIQPVHLVPALHLAGLLHVITMLMSNTMQLITKASTLLPTAFFVSLPQATHSHCTHFWKILANMELMITI